MVEVIEVARGCVCVWGGGAGVHNRGGGGDLG
jgi:hypothetical protein